MINNRHDYEAIIIANGHVIENKNILKLKGTFVIATDGGYDKCIALQIIPNLVIGDKDSIISTDYKDYLYIKDQDSTDLEKAILYCLKNDLNRVLILGAFGGELDHSLNNAMIISRYLGPERQFTIYDQYNSDRIKIGYFLDQTRLDLRLPINSTVSILPLPQAKISTIGFKWELKETELSFGFTSARNFNLRENIRIKCLSGKALIITDHQGFVG